MIIFICVGRPNYTILYIGTSPKWPKSWKTRRNVSERWLSGTSPN